MTLIAAVLYEGILLRFAISSSVNAGGVVGRIGIIPGDGPVLAGAELCGSPATSISAIVGVNDPGLKGLGR